MLKEIESLLVLQDRDQKIKSLQAQQKSLPRDKKTLEDKIAAACTLAEQAKQRLKENEVERRKLELDVEGKRTSIGRFKSQQQATRKNEEYQALNNEIAHFEKDIRALEDRELNLMEQAEEFQKLSTAADAEFARVQTILQKQIADLEAGAAAAAKRLQELESERTRLSAEIPPDPLALYQRLFSKKGDSAIAPLEHEICGGCHMKVPSQIAANTRAGQEIAQCPQCGRILYRVL